MTTVLCGENGGVKTQSNVAAATKRRELGCISAGNVRLIPELWVFAVYSLSS